MIDREIKEYIRLIGSLSLDKTIKDRISDFLIKNISERKDFSGKYVAVASVVAFLAVGTYFLTRGSKQDFNIM